MSLRSHRVQHDADKLRQTRYVTATLPLLAGLALFGFRAALVVMFFLLCVAAVRAAWRRVLPTLIAAPLLPLEVLLLVGFLPAELAGGLSTRGDALWPIIPAAALLYGGVEVLLQLRGPIRVMPMLVTVLLLPIFFGANLQARGVLRVDRLFAGDVLATRTSTSINPSEPWHRLRGPAFEGASLSLPLAANALEEYTRGNRPAGQSYQSLQALLRGSMRPLEDLIYAGQPSPLAMGSGLAILAAALLGAWRRIFDLRMIAASLAGAYASLLLLPTPLWIDADGRHFAWFTLLDPSVRFPAATTFVHYELFASPLLYVSVFLATLPGVSPARRLARLGWGVSMGVLCGVAQLYGSLRYGPPAALLVMQLTTPLWNRLWPAKASAL